MKAGGGASLGNRRTRTHSKSTRLAHRTLHIVHIARVAQSAHLRIHPSTHPGKLHPPLHWGLHLADEDYHDEYWYKQTSKFKYKQHMYHLLKSKFFFTFPMDNKFICIPFLQNLSVQKYLCLSHHNQNIDGRNSIPAPTAPSAHWLCSRHEQVPTDTFLRPAHRHCSSFRCYRVTSLSLPHVSS